MNNTRYDQNVFPLAKVDAELALENLLKAISRVALAGKTLDANQLSANGTMIEINGDLRISQTNTTNLLDSFIATQGHMEQYLGIEPEFPDTDNKYWWDSIKNFDIDELPDMLASAGSSVKEFFVEDLPDMAVTGANAVGDFITADIETQLATYANAYMAVKEGTVNLIEAVGDGVILAGAGIGYGVAQLGSLTNLYDVDTEAYWDGVMDVVKYDVSAAYSDVFYDDTLLGNWIAENSMMKDSALESFIVEATPFVVITVATGGIGGVAGAAVAGGSAAFVGFSDGTAEAWEAGASLEEGLLTGLNDGSAEALIELGTFGLGKGLGAVGKYGDELIAGMKGVDAGAETLETALKNADILDVNGNSIGSATYKDISIPSNNMDESILSLKNSDAVDINAGKTNLDSVVTSAKETGSAISNKADELISAGKGKVDELVTAGKTNLDSVVTSARETGSAISNKADELINAGRGKVDELVTAGKTNLDSVVTSAKETGSAISNKADELINAGRGKVDELVTAGKTNLDSVVTSAKETGSAISNKADELINAGKGKVDELVTAGKTNLDSVVTSAKETGSAISNKADELINAGKGKVDELVTAGKTNLDSVVTSAKETGSAISNKADELVNAGRGKVDELVTAGKTNLDSVVTSAKETGSAISNKADELINAGKGKVDELVTAAKTNLDEFVNSNIDTNVKLKIDDSIPNSNKIDDFINSTDNVSASRVDILDADGKVINSSADNFVDNMDVPSTSSMVTNNYNNVASKTDSLVPSSNKIDNFINSVDNSNGNRVDVLDKDGNIIGTTSGRFVDDVKQLNSSSILDESNILKNEPKVSIISKIPVSEMATGAALVGTGALLANSLVNTPINSGTNSSASYFANDSDVKPSLTSSNVVGDNETGNTGNTGSTGNTGNVGTNKFVNTTSTNTDTKNTGSTENLGSSSNSNNTTVETVPDDLKDETDQYKFSEDDVYDKSFNERLENIYDGDHAEIKDTLSELGYSDEEITDILKSESSLKEVVNNEIIKLEKELYPEVEDNFENNKEALMKDLKEYGYDDIEIDLIMKDLNLAKEAVMVGKLEEMFGSSGEVFNRKLELLHMFDNDKVGLENLLDKYDFNDVEIDNMLADKELAVDNVLSKENELGHFNIRDVVVENPDGSKTYYNQDKPVVGGSYEDMLDVDLINPDNTLKEEVIDWDTVVDVPTGEVIDFSKNTSAVVPDKAIVDFKPVVDATASSTTSNSATPDNLDYEKIDFSNIINAVVPKKKEVVFSSDNDGIN